MKLPRTGIAPDKIKLYRSLAPLIKDYRAWRGLSQETLAKLLQVSVRELQNWEANRRNVNMENLHDISETTGIPMQVCIALNADQPLWYSLRERRFAYSAIEMTQLRINDTFHCREQSDDGLLAKREVIATERHINLILACHQDLYDTKDRLEREVIKKAALLLPALNHIVFDCWGHYVGHRICLPLTRDDYGQLKTRQRYETFLDCERVSDIMALQEGVFFYYSSYAANVNIAHQLFLGGTHYLAGIDRKTGYLFAAYTATREIQDAFIDLGMKAVTGGGNITDLQTKPEALLYEIELQDLMGPEGPLGVPEAPVS